MSAITVPSPTKIASLCARSRCTACRASGPVISTGLRPAAAALPSARYGELEQDLRAAVADAAEVSGMDAHAPPRRPARRPRRCFRAQPLVPLPATSGLGSSTAETTRAMPARDDGVGAGRRLAVMRARLERDVERGAARRLAGAAPALRLGMRPPAGLGPAAADDDAVLDDDRADRGIGPGLAEPAPPQRQRQRHEASDRPRSDIASSLPRGPGAAASSPDNSPSTASKSLASRKLR